MKNWILTYTGRRFDPLDPDPAQIDIQDIAHALSNECRYTGHCVDFYSVAQHSSLVASMLLREGLYAARAGLLHDASEAYLCDIARPIKQTEGFSEYRRIESHLQNIIYEKFDLRTTIPPEVKIVDDRMMVTEAKWLMNGGLDAMGLDPTRAYSFRITPQEPRAAKADFMKMFDLLWWSQGKAEEQRVGEEVV